MYKIKNSENIFHILCAAFSVIVVISNIISAKMVKFPFFENFSLPAGLITYPLTFIISDLVTDVYSAAKAKLMVYIALGMNILSFLILEFAVLLPAQDPSDHLVFNAVLGLSGLRIFSSLTAYLISQIIDIQLYSRIKSWTGSRYLWIRNNGSTCISQLIDTLVVDIIFLYLGLKMPLSSVIPIMAFSYLYKAFFSFALTPLFYFLVFSFRKEQTKVDLA